MSVNKSIEKFIIYCMHIFFYFLFFILFIIYLSFYFLGQACVTHACPMNYNSLATGASEL